MKRLALTAAAILALTSAPTAQRGAPAKPLEIYVVDTEGGKAALWVAPSGQSLLIDSGNPGNRDLDRLMAAVNDAGVKQIDFLISTHYHVDHIGGLQELAKRIPIGHFIDHGPSVEEREQVQGFQAAYAELYGKAKHTVVKPGDKIPIAGLDWRIVTSAGQVLKTALPGGGKPNPACAGVAPKDASPTDDNGQSVGSVITFGQFRAIDLGDLSVEQGERPDVPEQSGRHCRRVLRHTSRARPIELSRARPRRAAARGDHAERDAKGSRNRGDENDVVVARPGGYLAAALVVQCRDRIERRGGLHRERRRSGDGCRGADGTAARRWTRRPSRRPTGDGRSTTCGCSGSGTRTGSCRAAGTNRRCARQCCGGAGGRWVGRRRSRGWSGCRGGPHARVLDQDVGAA